MKTLAQLSNINENLKTEKQSAEENFYEAKKQLELKAQAMKECEKRMSDWETTRQEAIKRIQSRNFRNSVKTFQSAA